MSIITKESRRAYTLRTYLHAVSMHLSLRFENWSYSEVYLRCTCHLHRFLDGHKDVHPNLMGMDKDMHLTGLARFGSTPNWWMEIKFTNVGLDIYRSNICHWNRFQIKIWFKSLHKYNTRAKSTNVYILFTFFKLSAFLWS